MKFQSENVKGRDHGESLSEDGRIILKLILRICCVRCLFQSAESGQCQAVMSIVMNYKVSSVRCY
jgi:hypothetical protein